MFNSTQRCKLKQLVLILPLMLLNACGGGSGQRDAGNTDKNAPTVSIKFPGLNAITEKNTVLVRGVAEDENAITYLAVNGVEATTSDGYANWQVTVPLQRGDNTLAVEVRDEFSNTDTAASSLQVVSIDRIMRAPARMALDAANNRLFVIDEHRNAVFEVSTVTGQRRIFSNATTPDALQPFSRPVAIALDTVNNRLLVADSSSSRDALFAVDMATGSRSIVSGRSATSELRLGGSFLSDLVVNASANIAYYSAHFDSTVISINLVTGERAILTSDTVPDEVNPFSSDINALVLDDANARLLVAVNDGNVFEVDLSTGQRSLFSAQDANDPRTIRGMVIDVSNGRILAVADAGASKTLLAIDLSTGDRSVLWDDSFPVSTLLYDIVFDDATNRALTSNLRNHEILSINLETGERSVLSGVPVIPGASFPDPILTAPGRITVDTENNRALIANQLIGSQSQIIAMNLDNGDVTVLSDNSTPDALNPFSIIQDLQLDAVNNRLLAFDWQVASNEASILSVNLSTGTRTVLSSNTIPDTSSPFGHFPISLAIDRDNNRVLALHSFIGGDGIMAVDLSTGARSILSDPITPNAAVPFDFPRALAVDAANGRVLVANQGNILAVGLATGARTVFSDVSAVDILVDAETNRSLLLMGNQIIEMDLANGNTTVIIPPSAENAFSTTQGFALDNTNDRLLVTDRGSPKALYAVDMVSGERVIVLR